MARPDLLVELDRAALDESEAGEAEFDAALDRVLAQVGAEAAPEPELRGVVHERLRHSLAAGAAGVAGSANTLDNLTGLAGLAHAASGVRRGASTGVWARYGSKLIILAAGVAIGFVWGRAPSWQDEPARSDQTAGVPAAAAPAPPPAGDSEDPLAPAASAPPLAPEATARMAVAPAARRPATRAHALPRARPRAAQDTTENAESLRLVLEQLRKAQLFSRAGEHRRALAALDELDARVPLSVLQDEREVARTLTLCDAGHEQAATELAARIIQRTPDSAYALSLRESCAGRSELLEQMRGRTSNPVP